MRLSRFISQSARWILAALVIFILVPLLLPVLQPRKIAYRAASNNQIRNIALIMRIHSWNDKHHALNRNFQLRLYKTKTTIEPHYRGDDIFKEIFSDFHGRHPAGGYYAFSGLDAQGNAKIMGDPATRLVIDVHDGKLDNSIGVGFSDGHVVSFPYPDWEWTDEKILEVLDKKGQDSL